MSTEAVKLSGAADGAAIDGQLPLPGEDETGTSTLNLPTGDTRASGVTVLLAARGNVRSRCCDPSRHRSQRQETMSRCWPVKLSRVIHNFTFLRPNNYIYTRLKLQSSDYESTVTAEENQMSY